MSQLSRPYQLALAAVLLFAVVYLLFLRPGDDPSEPVATLPAPAATTSAGAPTPTQPVSPGPSAPPATTTPERPATTTPEATGAPATTRGRRERVLVLAVVQGERSGDDARVREAVAGLGGEDVEVRTVTPDQIAADAELAAAAPVQQAPSVLILDRAGTARVFSGYTDDVTLREAVDDARKAG